MNTGIYIHIPFCQSKCRYCSFISRPWDAALAERYWRAVVRELCEFHAIEIQANHAVDSIYIGGGTPSLLPAEHIAAILKTCRLTFNLSPDCEISLEANPGTLDQGKLELYRSIGVNRISVGAQSFSDKELAAIGRIHTAPQIRESFALLRASGFRNLNLDLILGLPWQTERQWVTTLESAVELFPTHLSIYMLELDPKLPLYHAVSKGDYQIPDDDSIADWYLQTLDLLESRGYLQYEISNFARPGCECRHNLKYWLCKPVLAFGASGHSYDGVARYANVASIEAYLGTVESGRSPVEWREPLDADRKFEEMFYLGLRLSRGLDWEGLRRIIGANRLATCEAALREMVGLELLEWHNSVVRLTRRGMLLSNEVFQKFVRLGM